MSTDDFDAPPPRFSGGRLPPMLTAQGLSPKGLPVPVPGRYHSIADAAKALTKREFERGHIMQGTKIVAIVANGQVHPRR